MNAIFHNKEAFDKIYTECLENAPQASERVRTAYAAMHDAFEEYLDAIQEHNFRYFYKCGYEAGQGLMQRNQDN